MTDYNKEIERIKNPENIREAVYASSPFVLKKTFENDLTVRRLVEAGQDVIPLITKELESEGLNLHEITLACFAYILHKVNPESAALILKPLFKVAIENPGPFFVNFANQTLRQVIKLPTKPFGSAYTKEELLETLEGIKDPIIKDEEIERA